MYVMHCVALYSNRGVAAAIGQHSTIGVGCSRTIQIPRRTTHANLSSADIFNRGGHAGSILRTAGAVHHPPTGAHVAVAVAVLLP